MLYYEFQVGEVDAVYKPLLLFSLDNED